jgi:hypothetical protein
LAITVVAPLIVGASLVAAVLIFKAIYVAEFVSGDDIVLRSGPDGVGSIAATHSGSTWRFICQADYDVILRRVQVQFVSDKASYTAHCTVIL